MSNLIVNLDGGIGRVVCATPAIRKLAETNDVTVITPWPDVFKHNPYVQRIYQPDHPYLFDDVTVTGTYLNPEPYHVSAYWHQELHLIEAFGVALGVRTRSCEPEIFLSDEERAWAVNWIGRVRKETGKQFVIAYQPFGAGAQQVPWGVIDPTHRSLSTEGAMQLVDLITQKTRSGILVNCTAFPANHPNIWQQQFTLRELFAVCSVCDAFLGVDSSVSHVMAAFQKSGVHLLGATFRANIGYVGYVPFQREGFPKNYHPNRLQGFVDKNTDAMLYSSEMIDNVVNEIVTIEDRECPVACATT